MNKHIGLGIALDRDLDNISDAEEDGFFEIEIEKDIMTAGMFFDKEDLWSHPGRGKLRAFHTLTSFICVACQVVLSWVVFDEILFFELGFTKNLDKIEPSTYANYRRIYCFSGINETYWSYDPEV